MKTIPSLAGKVAVVTGASRGVGAGIAMLLGEQGATVYVTGRTTASKPGTIPGTISEVANSITTAGGVGIPVVCDHADGSRRSSRECKPSKVILISWLTMPLRWAQIPLHRHRSGTRA